MRPLKEPGIGAGQVLESADAFLALAFAWAEQGWIRDLDAALAHRLAMLAPDADAGCLLAAVMASHQAGQGHLLLDLDRARRDPRALIAVSIEPEAEDADTPLLPEALLSQLGQDWESRLRDWRAVGEGEGNQPLVLDNGRLYLRRYWRHEARIAQALAARLGAPREVSAATLRGVLDRLFPPADDKAELARWQKLACALGARSSFAVITGGPGTGKTTTVIRLLALLQVLAIEDGDAPLRIRLAAPTGKAAARLNASISAQIGQLADLALPQVDRVRDAIPSEVTTLHRLLGARPDTRRFRHHRFNPLPLDMVVVDEASMVDIEMMAALLDALPPQARLVLLGDKDQLASVEAGAVLGSLCARAEQAHYRPDMAAWLESAAGHFIPLPLQDREGRPLDQAVAMLRHSFRFQETSGIGQLARAVNAGDSRQAQSVLADDVVFPEVRQVPLPGPDLRGLTALALRGWRCEGARGYCHYLDAIHAAGRPAGAAERDDWVDWATGILEVHAQFQLLTPLRSGRYGVTALNAQIESALASDGLINRPDPASHWYEGRPVLVTGNDYGLGLMNGDIGIALQVPVAFGEPGSGLTLRVAFPSGDGGIRWVLPSRLQRIETVYAMTVHKSQGSEFVHTALVMPDAMSPVLTRELVYTAVTRAKSRFTLLCASDEVVAQAVERRVARQSQLGVLGSGPNGT
ncbi:MAG: exodeoxyribonuclease V subunit alpha [Chromatocurvus sp.]